jgi:thiosulfate/3-mercaptopyruvate sulfurtransferase
MNGNIVSRQWLAEHLRDRDLVIIDASWHLPTAGRNARDEFTSKHIPGAQFYDLDAGANPDSHLPHMLPSTIKFSADMARLGVNKQSFVVCYDSVGMFSAARLWWMITSMGHAKAAVLDAGLPKWEREGYSVEKGIPALPTPGVFPAWLDVDHVATLNDVAEALRSKSAQVVDARSPPRFRGEEAEPRPGVRPGHMPGAFNVHYATLLNNDGTLKSDASLRDAFTKSGVDLEKPIITSCGSGVTAAILSLALTQLNVAEHSLYDGSWAEWGASNEAIVTG